MMKYSRFFFSVIFLFLFLPSPLLARQEYSGGFSYSESESWCEQDTLKKCTKGTIQTSPCAFCLDNTCLKDTDLTCRENNLMYRNFVVDTCYYGCQDKKCKSKPDSCYFDEITFSSGATRCPSTSSYAICEKGIWIVRDCPSNFACTNNQCQALPSELLDTSSSCTSEENTCLNGEIWFFCNSEGKKEQKLCFNGCDENGCIGDKEVEGYVDWEGWDRGNETFAQYASRVGMEGACADPERQTECWAAMTSPLWAAAGIVGAGALAEVGAGLVAQSPLGFITQQALTGGPEAAYLAVQTTIASLPPTVQTALAVTSLASEWYGTYRGLQAIAENPSSPEAGMLVAAQQTGVLYEAAKQAGGLIDNLDESITARLLVDPAINISEQNFYNFVESPWSMLPEISTPYDNLPYYNASNRKTVGGGNVGIVYDGNSPGTVIKTGASFGEIKAYQQLQGNYNTPQLVAVLGTDGHGGFVIEMTKIPGETVRTARSISYEQYRQGVMNAGAIINRGGAIDVNSHTNFMVGPQGISFIDLSYNSRYLGILEAKNALLGTYVTYGSVADPYVRTLDPTGLLQMIDDYLYSFVK